MDVDRVFVATLRNARAGDQRAVASILESYEPRVYAVARALLGRKLKPHADPVDVVQSVHQSFLVALGNERYPLSSPREVLALALTLVRRKVAHIWRKAKRQRSFCDLQTQTRLSMMPCEIDFTRHVDAKDELAVIAAQLSPVEKRILDLRLQGFNSLEMGVTLRMSPGAIRVCWSRANGRIVAAK